MSETRRQTILTTTEDIVGDLLYYGRKEDNELPVGAIQEAIKAGEITEAEIVEHFAKTLRQGLARGGR